MHRCVKGEDDWVEKHRALHLKRQKGANCMPFESFRSLNGLAGKKKESSFGTEICRFVAMIMARAGSNDVNNERHSITAIVALTIVARLID